MNTTQFLKNGRAIVYYYVLVRIMPQIVIVNNPMLQIVIKQAHPSTILIIKFTLMWLQQRNSTK